MRTVVVLPAPFGPSSANTSPASISRSRPSSTRVAPKAFVRPCASIVYAIHNVYHIHLPYAKRPFRGVGGGGGDRDRRRGGAGRGDDGRGGQALRVHDDVALPARGREGGARAADARHDARDRAGAAGARVACRPGAVVARHA